ncbi:hypothetical protein DFH09DRAFT_1101222 [Mycena vulgaris]|nr:hypothetical protein DFH09DRAFT_1101222 [Mycena vulgaris]
MYWLEQLFLSILPRILAPQDPADIEGTVSPLTVIPPVQYFDRRSHYAAKPLSCALPALENSLLRVVDYEMGIERLPLDDITVNTPGSNVAFFNIHHETEGHIMRGIVVDTPEVEYDEDIMPDLVYSQSTPLIYAYDVGASALDPKCPSPDREGHGHLHGRGQAE